MAERPTAAELVEAVREFLERDIMPALEGRLSFHTRVAVNALSIVERELRMGPAHDEAARDRLTALLGGTDTGLDLAVASTDELERALAAQIRSGALDERFAETLDAVRAGVEDRLRVDNPKHLPAE